MVYPSTHVIVGSAIGQGVFRSHFELGGHFSLIGPSIGPAYIDPISNFSEKHFLFFSREISQKSESEILYGESTALSRLDLKEKLHFW